MSTQPIQLEVPHLKIVNIKLAFGWGVDGNLTGGTPEYLIGLRTCSKYLLAKYCSSACQATNAREGLLCVVEFRRRQLHVQSDHRRGTC